jgi:hypothetical protein
VETKHLQAPKRRDKVKQPPILFEKTQRLVARLSEQLRSPVVSYWNNPRGSVCHNDVVAMYELLETLGTRDRLFLFIKSDGGNGQAALRLVNLLRQHTRELVALVPLNCASAATMLALGANSIQMGPMAYLTAVDTSLTHDLSPVDRDNDRVSVSLDELNRVIRLWRGEKADAVENAYKTLFEHVHPLVVGAVDRAESLSIMLCKELLSYHVDKASTVDSIAEALNSKYPSHSFPILFEEAQRIGLKVERMEPCINTLLLELNQLYSEMGQKAVTDFDEINSHSNEIINIVETPDLQIYFQQDKEWFYRSEERRWISLNDNSSWRKTQRCNGATKRTLLHIA